MRFVLQTLLGTFLVLSIGANARRLRGMPNCVDGHSQRHRSLRIQCEGDDTYCGEWRGREWFPVGCQYRDITSAQARQCMKHKTIACIGDSQIRDFCIAVSYFLSGTTVEESPDYKYDHKSLDLMNNATVMHKFHSWQHNLDAYDGFVFPRNDLKEQHGWDWQVQVWELYANYFIENQVIDVLNNKMIQENNETIHLRPIDLAFWSHGLHDWGWWDKPPYGQRYYDCLVKKWLDVRGRVTVPSVWVSMNNQCVPKLKQNFKNMINPQLVDFQPVMVEEANYYVKHRLENESMPYFDAASVLRSPQRCEASGDGVHVKMWVDIVRAKILFNYLCDEHFNWVGAIDRFMM